MNYEDHLKFTYLFERPTEPLYKSVRGHGSTKYLFSLPEDHLEPYQLACMYKLRDSIPSSIKIVNIVVNKTTVPYDLTPVQQAVSRDRVFCQMNSSHFNASTKLTKILTDQSNGTEFFNACALCRDSINPHLWIHATIQAVSQRPDMRGFPIPAIWELMPDIFIESKVWKEAINQSSIPESNRAIVVIDKNFTGTNLNPEHKVAYFRDDIGANSHHWHWHVVNPSLAPKGTIDRKGEIFYYMHHGILARYDAERLANGLNRVEPFDIHHDVIKEAYFPKLTFQNSAMDLAGRQENTSLVDVDRSADPDTRNLAVVTVSQIRAWYDRIIEAIDVGFAIKEEGGRVSLRDDNGINIITAMQSSLDNPHIKYYGLPHNFGHGLIGCLHDPDYRYREHPGAMYTTRTSLRDPVFYRWHKFVDLVCQREKDYLPIYSRDMLQWDGLIINEIKMIRVDSKPSMANHLNPVNNMVTHWMQSDVELSRGLDFGRTNVNDLGPVWCRVTHLQHVPFVYRILVTNQTRFDTQATVRIFLAPKLDENGEKMQFYQQRIIFFELDKFVVSIRPGENLIERKSEDSTLTIPWAQSFRDVERNSSSLSREQGICNCGWPDYLLLPRGKVEGMPFDLFVMLTPTQVDQVPESKHRLGVVNASGKCRDAISYCGLIDDKIPDGKPMGYPFDRPAVEDERSENKMFLLDFVTGITNMGFTEVNMYHVNKTMIRENGAPNSLRKVYCSV